MGNPQLFIDMSVKIAWVYIVDCSWYTFLKEMKEDDVVVD